MKIIKVKVYNFRSFKNISVNLFPYTVIVGANNVGKSNILRALELFFMSLNTGGQRFIRRPFGWHTRIRPRESYAFESDFPVDLQENPGRKSTQISVTFELEDKDFKKLKLDSYYLQFKQLTIMQIIKASKNQTEPIYEYRCSNLLKPKLDEFIRWIRFSTDFVRIPSSRASEASNRLLKKFSNRIFANISGSTNVKRALKTLEKKAKEEIKKAGKSILKELIAFVPDLKSLNLELDELPEVSEILNISNIKIDDGSFTYLSNKGDGVQSLFYIGLMKYSASLRIDRNLIFGIEEPELHLHPDAQDELNKTLKFISTNNQVILTTHSPVLVNRGNIEQNIVVKKDKITHNVDTINTRSIMTIRDVLGVKPSHNLKNAKLVILTEGATDEKLLSHLLKMKSQLMESSLSKGDLRITHAHGANGIIECLEHYKRELQPSIALFDDDEKGRNAFKECEDKSLIPSKHLFKIPPKGNLQETEFEDLFPIKYTCKSLEESFGIIISESDYIAIQNTTGNSKKKPSKWTDVIRLILSNNGKSTSKDSIDAIKKCFADIVITSLNENEIPAFLSTLANVVSTDLA